MLRLFRRKKSSPPSAQTTLQASSKSEVSSNADSQQDHDEGKETASVSATDIICQAEPPTVAIDRSASNAHTGPESKYIPSITDATTQAPDQYPGMPGGFDSGYEESSESSSNPDEEEPILNVASKDQEDSFDQLIASDSTFVIAATHLLKHYLCEHTANASLFSRIRNNVAYYGGRNHKQAVSTVLQSLEQHNNLVSLARALHSQGVTNPNPDGHLMKILNALNRKFQADTPLRLKDYFKEEATTQALAGTSIN